MYAVRILSLLSCVGACIAVGPIAEAEAGWWPGDCGYYALARNSALGRIPPYFAEFPPVYYSGPVARPYGYYPYAYPAAWHQHVERVPYFPRVMARAVVEAVPAAPVPQPPAGAAPKTPRRARPTAGPVVILNPFCQPGADSTQGVAASDGVTPQVVFPMATELGR